MREAIATAPRTGVFIILEDAAHGTLAVARWSAMTSQWLDDDDKPVQLNATHWHLPQTLDGKTTPEERNTKAGRPPPIAEAAPSGTSRARFAILSGRAHAWIIRRRLSMATMAACFFIGAALSTLLYRPDVGLGRFHWTASDADAGLKQALEQQQERINELTLDLTTSRQEGESQAASIRQAGEGALATLRQSLQLEMSKTEKLAEELADVQRDRVAQAALTRKAIDEAIHARKTGMALAEALQQQRDKVEELGVALAAARREEADRRATWRSASSEASRLQEANARVTDALREALRQVEGKAEKLAGALAEAQRQVDAQKLATQAANDEAQRASDSSRQRAHEQSQTLREAQGKMEKLATELANARQSLEAERGRAEQLEQRLIALQTVSQDHALSPLVSPAPAAAEFLRSTTVADARTNAPAGDEAQSRTSSAGVKARFEQPSAPAVRLIARANLLLDQGNIGAARNMFDQAAEMGSAEALFWLAETYDPLLLPTRKTLGTQSDVAKAREFYAKALAGGVDEARSRLESLQK